jgi:hypothetical protein
MKKYLKKNEITHGHMCDELFWIKHFLNGFWNIYMYFENVKYKKCVLKNVNVIF